VLLDFRENSFIVTLDRKNLGDMMAKEICPTPVLEGKDAVKFLLDSIKPPSAEKRKFLERIRKEHQADLF
jgi:hypothetical protein